MIKDIEFINIEDKKDFTGLNNLYKIYVIGFINGLSLFLMIFTLTRDYYFIGTIFLIICLLTLPPTKKQIERNRRLREKL